MGNRGGVRHLLNGLLAEDRSPSAARWIACSLTDTAGSRATQGTSAYAKLFFLDEATALAAGHRPCWLCRREDAASFLHAWNRVTGGTAGLDELDQQLRVERNELSRPRALATDLPDGVFVRTVGTPFLLSGDRAHRWTPVGYDGDLPVAELGEVEVLTPATTVEVIRAGYPVRIGAAPVRVPELESH